MNNLMLQHLRELKVHREQKCLIRVIRIVIIFARCRLYLIVLLTRNCSSNMRIAIITNIITTFIIKFVFLNSTILSLYVIIIKNTKHFFRSTDILILVQKDKSLIYSFESEKHLIHQVAK